MEILLFLILHWYLSLFFQTFFLHRYAAHSMFTMSTFWERMCFIGTFITQGASYLSPTAYGILHRMHHANTDTEKDPHSPKFDKTLINMMWKTRNIYQAIFAREYEVEAKYEKGVPRWPMFEKIAHSWLTRGGWMGFYTALYLIFATEWWMFLFLPIHFTMGPIHGAIINWFAHKYGYRNYDVEDTSTNLWAWDLLMLGEGLHNNHHKHSSSANFGSKWWEFDPVYPVIKVLNAIHIIRLKAV